MDQDLSQRLQALVQQAKQLTRDLQEVLERMPSTIEEGEVWPEWTTRWEQIETVVSALEVCQQLLQEGESQEIAPLCRALRRWRRLEGARASGWIEVRWVKGYGPYVYFRWRWPGEPAPGK